MRLNDAQIQTQWQSCSPLPGLLNSKWQTFNIMAAIVCVEARDCVLIIKDMSIETKWIDKLTSPGLSPCKMKRDWFYLSSLAGEFRAQRETVWPTENHENRSAVLPQGL